MSIIRLGTRGSLLARSQAALIARQIQDRHPTLEVETVLIKTTGDQITDRPLYESGGKGLFIKELELALLSGQIDFAVHSCKDVPITMPLVDQADLVLAAIPVRADPCDLLICKRFSTIDQLPMNATVATGSLRRRCQLLDRRGDFRIQPVRGNIDTRIKKYLAGEFDATILAIAGITRAELFDESIMHPILLDEMLPAPGQGALALQCRRNDEKTLAILSRLDHAESRIAVEAERAVVAALNGDCHSPIAALAQIKNGQLHLRAAVGQRDGAPPVVRASASVALDRAADAATAVVEQLQRGPTPRNV
jgi:hydroxymethylbilane synthase